MICSCSWVAGCTCALACSDNHNAITILGTKDDLQVQMGGCICALAVIIVALLLRSGTDDKEVISQPMTPATSFQIQLPARDAFFLSYIFS